MSSRLPWIALAGAVLAVAGCGLKGPLYMPPPKPAAAKPMPAPAPAPAATVPAPASSSHAADDKLY